MSEFPSLKVVPLSTTESELNGTQASSLPESIDSLDFQGYLRAKQSVDDRALNLGVYAELRAALAAISESDSDGLDVLEIGCGIGAMIDRLARWGLWNDVAAGGIRYTALDQLQANLDAISPSTLKRVRVEPVCDDFHAFALRAIAEERTWDVLIASAVLDLFNLERELPLLRELLRPGGVAWLTLNFDGGTILLPTIERDFDALVEQRYHRTMDERLTDGVPSGDSQTGRHLFDALPAAGLEIVAAGASDWAVYPVHGGYYGDEARFLHFIVETMQGALAGDDMLDAEQFAAWIELRKQQIGRGELTYLAKQYDFLVRRAD